MQSDAKLQKTKGNVGENFVFAICKFHQIHREKVISLLGEEVVEDWARTDFHDLSPNFSFAHILSQHI